MRDNPSDVTRLQGQLVQEENTNDVLRGEVVDVRDPWRLGRVRLQIYSMNGDYPLTDISTLLWSEPITSLQGSFGPPQLGDRMLCAFEAGSKYAPTVLGHLKAHPRGQGLLPWNKRDRSEIRPEGQHHHDMYPESIIFGASGNGNIVGINDIFMVREDDPEKPKHRGNLASQIYLQDTGGKFFRIRSFHREVQHYSPVARFPIGKGTLYKTDYGENVPIRSGYETNEDLEEKVGLIEFGDVSTKRQIVSSESDFTMDQCTQLGEATQEEGEEGQGGDEFDPGGGNQEKALNYDQEAVSGKMYKVRQERSTIMMMDSMISIMAQKQVFTSPLLTPPRRWDN